MILNSTSVGYKNLTNGQGEEFLRRHTEVRRRAEIPRAFKGRAREHSAAQFGCTDVNYFDKNIRNGPLFPIQGKRTASHQVAHQLEISTDAPPAQRSTVCS